jgi:hypothetical protein
MAYAMFNIIILTQMIYLELPRCAKPTDGILSS